MTSNSFLRAFAIGAGMALVLVLIVLGFRQATVAQEPIDFDPAQLTGAPVSLDAPFVPTEHAIVERMLEMAQVGRDDYVIDLGSGDGRILIAAAAQRGARGLGVDIDPARIRDSRFNARAAGVTDKVRFRRQDLFETSLREASVLTLYLLPEINLRLRPRILAEMRPGARVVSHAFDMGEWRWDRRELVEGATVYMWTVPASIEGDWRLVTPAGEAALRIEQRFQQLTGTVTLNGRSARIERGRVMGETIRFVADLGEGRRLFEGRLDGSRIAPTGGQPSYPVAPATGWHAVRGG